jgi:hypothetical protein
MRIIFGLILILISIFVSAQKQDYNWCFGDSVGINFNVDPPVPFNCSVNSHECSASISDLNGNLKFYVGGINDNTYYLRVWNKNHAIMQNGDSLVGHSSFTMGTLIIPFITDTNKYFIFHFQVFGGFYLFYSVVDLSFNNGSGKVISKNNLLYNNTPVSEKFIAVKHANGRDWWIIFHEKSNGTFVKYLIINDIITGPYYQTIGSVYSSSFGGDMGEMEVSQYGDKIVATNLWGMIDLYDFDRCTGELSNWIDLGYNHFIDYSGCAFSDKGERLYVSQFDSLFQFNLLAADILASRQLIWPISYQHDWHLGQLQIGPDKKIYLANTSGQSFPNNIFDTANMNLSVINNPEGIGQLCDFQPYSFNLGGRRSFFGLPNMPNYNLGALDGSPCDTLTTIKQFSNQDKISIFPNPTNGFINIEIQNYNKTNIQVLTLDGQIIKDFLLTKSRALIDISEVPQGLYMIKIIMQDKVINKKIIKE